MALAEFAQLAEDYSRADERANRIFDMWHHLLLSEDWQVVLRTSARPLQPANTAFRETAVTCATTSVDWQYLEATLSFDADAIERIDDRELEEVIVHECMHVLLNEMRADDTSHGGQGIMHEERVATMLQRAIMRVATRFAAQPTAPAYPDYEG